MIGVPTLAASDPQLGGAAAGIGFAIPSNRVRDIAGQIVKNGKVDQLAAAPTSASRSATPATASTSAASAAGGPAAKAGIQVGDVIVAIAGKPTPTSDELGSVLAAHKPGQTVKVRIMRQNGSSATVDVTLGEYPGG